MRAGMGHTNHFDAGPSRSRIVQATISRAIPNRNRTKRNGAIMRPTAKKDRPKIIVAKMSIAMSPTALVAIAVSTRPLRYSESESGEAKRFRKLRDHTSSRNAMVTPYMTREKKSQRRTAPSRAGTKLKPEEVTVFRYLVMNPHNTMSMITHTTTDITREGFPRMR